MKEEPALAATAATGQTWNTEAYAESGRFVADLATGVIDLLAAEPGERILDVGCGDGALTERLSASGAILTGVDASASMVEAARTRNLDVRHVSATALSFCQEFDAVFSNAALHWIPAADQPAALRCIHNALKPGARFVAEMGGQGNIAAIRTALSATLAPLGIDAEASAASFFPSPELYRSLLEAAGFEVLAMTLIGRPTPLPGGEKGLQIWLDTFRNGVLYQLRSRDRSAVVQQITKLLRPILCDQNGDWTADYVRLCFHARRRS